MRQYTEEELKAKLGHEDLKIVGPGDVVFDGVTADEYRIYFGDRFSNHYAVYCRYDDKWQISTSHSNQWLLGHMAKLLINGSQST